MSANHVLPRAAPLITRAEASDVRSPAVSEAEARGGQKSQPSRSAAAPLFLVPVESEWPLCLWSRGQEAA